MIRGFRNTIALVALGGLLLGAPGAASAKPVQVFKDVSGDAGNQDSALPGANEAGFDIVGGTIDKKGKDLVFTVAHSAMPASNQPGEAFRFLWHFDVGKKQYRFTVKSFDLGKPDVIAQSGTERVGQVYANGVARLEEGYVEPGPALQLAQFSVVDYYDVVFDAAKATVSWKMPLAALKLKKGSLVAPGTGGSTGTGCQVCWIPHYAERSLTPHTIIDSAVMTKGYKVP
jgi:hypothetical protein